MLGFSETKSDKTLRKQAFADLRKKARIKAEIKKREAEIVQKKKDEALKTGVNSDFSAEI